MAECLAPSKNSVFAVITEEADRRTECTEENGVMTEPSPSARSLNGLVPNTDPRDSGCLVLTTGTPGLLTVSYRVRSENVGRSWDFRELMEQVA